MLVFTRATSDQILIYSGMAVRSRCPVAVATRSRGIPIKADTI